MLTSLPSGKTIVGSKWVFKVKHKPHGSVDRYKAQLVAKGYTQVEGEDFLDSYASMTKIITLPISSLPLMLVPFFLILLPIVVLLVGFYTSTSLVPTSVMDFSNLVNFFSTRANSIGMLPSIFFTISRGLDLLVSFIPLLLNFFIYRFSMMSNGPLVQTFVHLSLASTFFWVEHWFLGRPRNSPLYPAPLLRQSIEVWLPVVFSSSFVVR